MNKFLVEKIIAVYRMALHHFLVRNDQKLKSQGFFEVDSELLNT